MRCINTNADRIATIYDKDLRLFRMQVDEIATEERLQYVSRDNEVSKFHASLEHTKREHSLMMPPVAAVDRILRAKLLYDVTSTQQCC